MHYLTPTVCMNFFTSLYPIILQNHALHVVPSSMTLWTPLPVWRPGLDLPFTLVWTSSWSLCGLFGYLLVDVLSLIILVVPRNQNLWLSCLLAFWYNMSILFVINTGSESNKFLYLEWKIIGFNWRPHFRKIMMIKWKICWNSFLTKWF